MSWALYDALIDGIPSGLKVERCAVGVGWTAVQAESLGLAMTLGNGDAHMGIACAGDIVGRDLRDVAAWVKSWDYARASIGLAAINAAVNAPDTLFARFDLAKVPQDVNAFTLFAPAFEGKTVGMIGHFRDLELLKRAAKVHILERIPLPGDLPDPACEYVLSECDVVFITSVTLANKTLPRLLELSAQAQVVLVGPGVPMHPLLFDFGVTALSGLFVSEAGRAFQVIEQGGGLPLLRQKGAQFMNLTQESLRHEGTP